YRSQTHPGIYPFSLHDALPILRKLGVELSDPITQNDVTFVDANYGAYDKFQAGKNILRIREHNGTYLFTLKQAQHNELDCIEYRSEEHTSELRHVKISYAVFCL